MLLLEPATVGSATMRNRLVFGPHETNLGRGRSFSERHVDYYRRRATGGCGLIVTEEASVHDSDWPYERAPLAAESGSGWAAVAAACHQEGAACVAAIGHAGLQGSSAYSQRELWAPSLVADAVTRELPKEMEPDDIAAVLDGFEAAARIAVDAGMDGVEVNAGQHSLVRQFLSGLTNLRGDDWGGDETGRIRFADEVLQRARAAIGSSVLGLRLSCDELAPWAGLTPDSAAQVAETLARHVDYLVVVRGSIFSVDATRPDANVEAGFNVGLVQQIHAAVDAQAAVVAQGSIIDPGQAEWALTDGRAELVEMTRAQIADPDLAHTLASGGRPRPCLLCNQRCRVRDARNPLITCVVNPSAGYEAAEPELPTRSPARAFAVIGAGPAGLELARCLATAGHQVTVIDRALSPGGAVPSWAYGPGREPLGALVGWLADECGRLGVTLELGHETTPGDIAGLEAEGTKVVLCTGGRAGRREYAVDPTAVVITAAELLAKVRDSEEIDTGPVAVWDPIGGPIGINAALTLASRGSMVTLITPDVITGTQLASTGDLAAASTRLLQAGVTVVKRKVLRAAHAETVEIEDRFNGERAPVPADFLVDAGHRLANDELWRATGEQLPRAGDCVAPRTIYEAMLEGRRLAVSLAAAAPEPAGTH